MVSVNTATTIRVNERGQTYTTSASLNSFLNDLISEGVNANLAFSSGKIDVKKTLEKIHPSVNMENVNRNEGKYPEWWKQLKRTTRSIRVSLQNSFAIKILSKSLYTVFWGIFKAAIRTLKSSYQSAKTRRISHRIDKLVRFGIIGIGSKMELQLASREGKVFKKANENLLIGLRESGCISENEYTLLNRHLFKWQCEYLIVREMLQDQEQIAALATWSLRALRKERIKQESIRAKSDLSHFLEELKEVCWNDELTKLTEKQAIVTLIQKIDLDQVKPLQLRFKLYLLKNSVRKKSISTVDLARILWKAEHLSTHYNALVTIQEHLKKMSTADTPNIRELENRLYTLQQIQGMLLQNSQYDYPKLHSEITGRFLFQWRKINELMGQRCSDNPLFYHRFNLSHFSSSQDSTWPLNNQVYDVLENSTLEDYAAIGTPIKVRSAEDAQLVRPRIAIFSCNSGSGHKMASISTAQCLPDCDVQLVDVYGDILRSIDAISWLYPEYTCDDIYNVLMKNECIHALSFLQKIVPFFVSSLQAGYEKEIEEFIKRENPDMLISTIPIINAAFIKVAEKYQLPLLVVTTDLETDTFLSGVNPRNCPVDYDRVKFTFAYNVEATQGEILKKIPPDLSGKYIYDFGYPLRQGFSTNFTERQLQEIRDEFGIKKGEKVILTMIGGNNSRAVFDYAQMLADFSDMEIDEAFGEGEKVRMICLCGDTSTKSNEAIREQITQLNKNQKRVRFTAVGRTSKIAQIVSLPELFAVITKPGGSSTNEMLKKKVLMIFHTNGKIPPWEEGNMQYAIHFGMGVKMDMRKRVINDHRREDLKQAFRATRERHHELHSQDDQDLSFLQPNYQHMLRKTVREMLLQSA